jgi:hypothetical protein
VGAGSHARCQHQERFGETLDVGAEEVADAVGVLYALDVDGECGENLEDAVEEYPAAEAGFAGGCEFKVGCHLKLLEFVDEGRTW